VCEGDYGLLLRKRPAAQARRRRSRRPLFVLGELALDGRGRVRGVPDPIVGIAMYQIAGEPLPRNDSARHTGRINIFCGPGFLKLRRIT